MRNSKVFLIVFLFITSLLSLFAQNKLSDLEGKDFLQDFDLLVNIIKEQHPNPYKFIGEKAFNKKTDSLRKLLKANPNIYSFKKFSPLKLIRDVHLGQTMSEELAMELNKSLLYFPLPVYVEKGTMFVNIKNQDIPFGAEIISINNISAQELLRNLAQGKADGYIQTDVDRLSADFGYYVSFLYPEAKSYTITYVVHKGEKPQEKVLNSLDYASYYYRASKAVMPYNLLQKALSVYSDLVDDKQTGVLTVNTFSISEPVAYKYFSSFFKEVNQKKYKNVIIDVRNNNGGDPAIAALLYSFISKTKLFSNEYSYRIKRIGLSYPEYLIAEDNRNVSEDDILQQNNFMYQRFDKDTISGFYIGNERLDEGFIRNYPKDKDAFSGNVYVLTGSETISAATYFASLVKINKRGIILGKETTSGVNATMAAWFFTYQLPKTKLFVIIPRSEIYFFDATQDSGRGLMPDQELEMGLFHKYMIEGKDPEMTYVFDLIDLS